MDFPAYVLKRVPVTDEMEDAIGVRPQEAWMARDLVCVLSSENEVVKYTPDLEKVKKLPGLLLHTTAKGENSDCTTRTYAPKLTVMKIVGFVIVLIGVLLVNGKSVLSGGNCPDYLK